jgi:hypothetical protein
MARYKAEHRGEKNARLRAVRQKKMQDRKAAHLMVWAGKYGVRPDRVPAKPLRRAVRAARARRAAAAVEATE